jgi:hypothetical protein
MASKLFNLKTSEEWFKREKREVHRHAADADMNGRLSTCRGWCSICDKASRQLPLENRQPGRAK